MKRTSGIWQSDEPRHSPNEGRVAMPVDKLVKHFSVIEDPRCAGTVEHRLIDWPVA
jgi:hypothetical protein